MALNASGLSLQRTEQPHMQRTAVLTMTRGHSRRYYTMAYFVLRYVRTRGESLAAMMGLPTCQLSHIFHCRAQGRQCGGGFSELLRFYFLLSKACPNQGLEKNASSQKTEKFRPIKCWRRINCDFCLHRCHGHSETNPSLAGSVSLNGVRGVNQGPSLHFSLSQLRGWMSKRCLGLAMPWLTVTPLPFTVGPKIHLSRASELKEHQRALSPTTFERLRSTWTRLDGTSPIRFVSLASQYHFLQPTVKVYPGQVKDWTHNFLPRLWCVSLFYNVFSHQHWRGQGAGESNQAKDRRWHTGENHCGNKN